MDTDKLVGKLPKGLPEGDSSALYSVRSGETINSIERNPLVHACHVGGSYIEHSKGNDRGPLRSQHAAP